MKILFFLIPEISGAAGVLCPRRASHLLPLGACLGVRFSVNAFRDVILPVYSLLSTCARHLQTLACGICHGRDSDCPYSSSEETEAPRSYLYLPEVRTQAGKATAASLPLGVAPSQEAERLSPGPNVLHPVR